MSSEAGEASPDDALRTLLPACRVLPVVTVPSADAALGLVDALAAGGLTAVEITLRTEAALAAIERVAAQRPEIVVAAGTVTEPDELRRVRDAGARFAVSPGLSQPLIEAAREIGLPWMPGVATVSEAMHARRSGHRVLKIFPAESVGGPSFLRSMAGPLPDLAFCPTGGIGASTYRDYLAQPNVLCVGGSWMAPSDWVAASDWPAITREAARITS